MKFLRSSCGQVLLSRTRGSAKTTITIKGRPWFWYSTAMNPDKAVELAVRARRRGYGSARAVRDSSGWYTIYVRQTKVPAE
jgi:hypothetical protein